MKDLKDLVRPNVWNMKPYSSARDEFQGNASVFLDANENPFNRPYNRYPDPLQWELKKKIAEIKGVKRDRSDYPCVLRTVYRQHRKHRAFLRHV